MCQHGWAELHTHNFLSCVFPASAGQKRDPYRRLGGQKWSSSRSVDHTHCHSSADSPCLCEAADGPVIASPWQGSSFYFSKSWARLCLCPWLLQDILITKYRGDKPDAGFTPSFSLCLWVRTWSYSFSSLTHLPFPTSVLWTLDSRTGHKNHNLTETHSCIGSSHCNKSMYNLGILLLWLNPDWCRN